MTYKELLWFALRRTSDNQLIFNFTCLDGIIQMLHDLNLMPGFEMMGNPSGYFTDLEDHFQIMLFADLAFQLASRYIGLFYYYCYFR